MMSELGSCRHDRGAGLRPGKWMYTLGGGGGGQTHQRVRL